MKAVVYKKYGSPDVLQLKEIAKPNPKRNEILIKIHATSVSAGDIRMRKAQPFLVRLFSGIFRPTKVKILGFELSGEIETAGEDISKFKSGDHVFAFSGFGFGTYAEYICMSEASSKVAKGIVAIKPSNISFEEAATIPAGSITAMAFLRKADIQKGQSILIYGASGSVGTYTVQLAKYYGAKVTGVCSSSNLEMVMSLGADQVIDYTRENFWGKIDQKYDIVFDAVGKASKSDCKKALKSKGKYLTVMGSGKEDINDLDFIRELIEAGKVKAIIDKQYTLDQIQEAHEYVDKGHKKGNVAIKVV